MKNKKKKVLNTTSKIFDMISKEADRQENNAELIASENFVSDNIRLAVGSILTNKYAEGYPDVDDSAGQRGRYYGGCRYIDEIEDYCRKIWQKAFNTDYHVNVQPHSGANANTAAYLATLKPGETALSMSLENGGHLSHGLSANISGKLYNFIHYDVDVSGYIDYQDLKTKIDNELPKLILAGASAYPRQIDFKKIYDIIQEVKEANPGYNPYFMVDMAHIAGLIVAGDHPTPFGYADIITTTTHKTLRGPRGGLIFCKSELAKKIDSAVFPGLQGGPLEHVIAGKAICAEEACTDEYKEYIHQVVKNCAAMANRFTELGYDVITGGTDNHLFLLDFSKTHPNITGLDVQNALEKHNITLNKNAVPNDLRGPKTTSGVRIGTAAMTTKGWTEQDFINCADQIDCIIDCM